MILQRSLGAILCNLALEKRSYLFYLFRVTSKTTFFRHMQIQENMKAVDVIPLLTPAVMEKIEAVVQSKPKRPESFR